MKWLYYLENEEDDVILMRTGLSRVGCRDCLRWFQAGRDFKETLLSLLPTQLPKVILIDLKLNGECGLDIAAWLAEQPGLRHIPAFVFSSGRLMHEIVAALEKNAMGYLFKPSSLEGWVEIAQNLKGISEAAPCESWAAPASSIVEHAVAIP